MPETQKSKHTVSKLLLINMVVSVLIIIGLGFSTISSINEGNKTLESVYEDRLVPGAHLQQITASLNLVRFRMAGYALVLVRPQGAALDVQKHNKMVQESWQKIKSSSYYINAPDAIKKELQEIDAHQPKLKKFFQNALDGFEELDSDAITELLELRWPEVEKHIFMPIDKILKYQLNSISEVRQENRESGYRLKAFSAIFVFIGFILNFFVSMIVMRKVGRQTKKISDSLNLIKEQKKSLEVILNNVETGLFVVGRDFCVQEGFSISCKKLLTQEFRAGTRIAQLLFPTSISDQDFFEGSLFQLFDDRMPVDINLMNLEQVFQLNSKTIGISGHDIRDDSGQIVGVLFNARDLTSLKKFEEENQKKEILIQILGNKDAFRVYLRDTKAQLNRIKSMSGIQNQDIVRGILHTIKGNSSMFEISELTSLIHTVEDKEEVQLEDIDKIEKMLTQFVNQYSPITGIQYDLSEKQELKLSEEKVLELESIIEEMGEANPSAKPLLNWLHKIKLKPALSLMGKLQDFTTGIGKKLGKQVKLEVRGGRTLLDPLVFEPVYHIFSHLIRNAVDHGIELPINRVGKPKIGKVTFEFSDKNNSWQIVVSDDGQGLNYENIKNLMLERGIITQDKLHLMNNKEIAELIFWEGFSTSKKVTDVSGRGIGMSEVKRTIEDLGGSIAVESTEGTGTTFVIDVPKKAA